MNDFRLRDCQIGKWGCSIQGSIAIQLILTTDCTFCRLCGLPLEVTVKREQRRWRWTPQIRKTSHSVELTKIYYHNTLLTKSSWKQLIREVTKPVDFTKYIFCVRDNFFGFHTVQAGKSCRECNRYFAFESKVKQKPMNRMMQMSQICFAWFWIILLPFLVIIPTKYD